MRHVAIAAALALPLPAIAQEGLVDQVAALRCAAAKAERAAFLSLSADDVAMGYGGDRWEPIAVPENGRLFEGQAVEIPVDYDADYRFIRFRTGDDHLLDYDHPSGRWKNTAWNLNLQWMRIDDRWLNFYQQDFSLLPGRLIWPLRSFGNNVVSMSPIGLVSSTQRPQLSTGRCREADERRYYCFTEFYLKLPATGKLTALSDVESVVRGNTGDNAIRYDIELSGLAAPEQPEDCQ